MSRVLVHFRLTTPSDLSGEVLDLLRERRWTTNVTVQRGACLDPEGDLIECDVAREKAGVLLHCLNEAGLDRRGGIVVSTPTGTPFERAEEIEALAPGHPDDAVIWEGVEAKAADGAQPTVSFHVFLVLAVALAAIAVVTDSAILVVGAMVVGPEFSAIAAASAGVVLGSWSLVYRSLRLLLFSFVFAILVVAVLAVGAHLSGAVTPDMITRPRPNTGFIWKPDIWSFVVALIAGAAGVLALAIDRANVMVGVFISVTTVPAAGNLALGIALWQRQEIVGSLEQLGANVAGMLVSGVLVLAVMKVAWPAITAGSERLPGWSGRRRT
ncbi:DUF389 domain-containing protein [Nocardioides ginsengisegetis]